MAIKKEEREKLRQQAIDHNNAQRELLTRQAADGRKLHPSLIAKQADRYREATRQADLAAKQAQEATKQAQEAAKRGSRIPNQPEAARCAPRGKVKELSKLDQDIDRLRAMRDQERGHGLNH